MLTPTPATWIVRGATFALWALAAGSAVFWGLKVSGSTRPLAVPAPAPRQVALADPVSIAKLLGSSPSVVAAAPVVALASRFQLLGVAAGTRSGEGAAVIAVDGKPPRAYRVGSPLDENYSLKSVRGREAVIASQRDGQAVATLEVPQVKMDTTSRAPAPVVAPGVTPPFVPQPMAPVAVPPPAPVVPQALPQVQPPPVTPQSAPGRRHAPRADDT
jgi:general secretion pathway protein C